MSYTSIWDCAHDPDLRNRVLFTLGLLAVYRLGAAIPIPGVDAIKFEEFFSRNQRSQQGSAASRHKSKYPY